VSLKIISENPDEGILTIQLDNGDYKVLNEIFVKWGIKDRENALRFGLAILNNTEKGTLCKKEDNGKLTIFAPADEIAGGENASEE